MTNPPLPPKARRSDPTRARILQAARERFTAEGYDRATIRAVAADADIDPSMVMRYFGSKEGLFAAAARFDLEFPDLTRLPRDKIGAGIVAHFLNRWEDDPTDTLRILLRAAVSHEKAVERMHEVFRMQLTPALARVVPDRVAERAALVVSQMVGLAFCRYVLRLPAVMGLDRDMLVRHLGPTIQRYAAEPWPESA